GRGAWRVTLTSATSTGSAPTATTGTASTVTATAATLNGTVNPNGLTTTAFFQWGTTTAYGNTTASLALGSGTSTVAAFAQLSGLLPNTTYHFRIVASSSQGTTNGLDGSFTTGGATSLSNLALNKAATQSSDPGWGGPASKAVDGNTDGVWADGSVTHTNFDAQAWWQVDLGSTQAVQHVDVWNRTDCCGARLSNFNVLLLDSTQTVVASAYVAGQAASPTSVALRRTARYVKVQLVGTNYLSLAEVQVWGSVAVASSNLR